jgi:hydroxylamine reductase
MFCYQCEQTAKGTACTAGGVCGKSPEVAALQDLLTYSLKGLSQVAVEARAKGVVDNQVDRFTAEALFSTLTNVDFDPERFVALIKKSAELRDGLKAKLAGAGFPDGPAIFTPAGDLAGLIAQGEEYHFKVNDSANEDINSLVHLLIFGLRGLAAYADHAAILGQEGEEVWAFLHEGLAATIHPDAKGLRPGAQVRRSQPQGHGASGRGQHRHLRPPGAHLGPLGAKAGKAILVSGHDLKDLAMLLKQTEGKGINVYTHGEMLPTHGYPELKKYEHFYGHYGTAWQNQGKEFAAFPGAILMTTNCIQKPKGDYQGENLHHRLVGWPGVTHIEADASQQGFLPGDRQGPGLPGFASDDGQGSVMVTGFARNAVLGVADKVIEAVKGGAIKHFFLVAAATAPSRAATTTPSSWRRTRRTPWC